MGRKKWMEIVDEEAKLDLFVPFPEREANRYDAKIGDGGGVVLLRCLQLANTHGLTSLSARDLDPPPPP
jgi:hypothetical protein